MLDDKDRTFRNLYGLEDWGLEGACRRVAYGILVEVAESA
jgi:NADH-quinone oxidoreductase subunit F